MEMRNVFERTKVLTARAKFAARDGSVLIAENDIGRLRYER